MSNQFRLLLFIVVISGALCTVEDYVIMSQCAHNKAIHVAAEGTVSVTDISQTQNITIVGLPDYVNNNLKIALYAKETQRYLCFNDQWKLVGMKELRDTCYFNETIVHGYFVFRSVVDLQRRVGFTHRGKAVGPKKNINDACYLFTKIQADQFFHQHTNNFAPKSKSTKTISTSLQTKTKTTTPTTLTKTKTPATHTTSGASSRLLQQRVALSAAATTATATVSVTATTAHRNYGKNKSRRVNGMHNNKNNNSNNSNNNNNNRNSNNNQNQEYTNGHNSSLSNNNSNSNSNNKNNSDLVNNNNNNEQQPQQQQHLVVSHQKHHNKNNNNRTRDHVRQHQHHQQQQQNQQTHQVRHHHNDPNSIARRQQHEHKQKRRQHQQQHRLHSNNKVTSPSTIKHIGLSLLPTATTISYDGSKRHNRQHEKQQQQQHDQSTATVATKVAVINATATTTAIRTTTTIANKRKGRRRKGRKHKKQQRQQQHNSQQKQQSPLTAGAPTQTTWGWSDTPTPALALQSEQTLRNTANGISTSTAYEDYSGEWTASLGTSATAARTAAALLLMSSPSPAAWSVSNTFPTHVYSSSMAATLTTTDSTADNSLPALTPTNDYSNVTGDFTSNVFGEEDSPLNTTVSGEMSDESLSSETALTSATGAQLNSIIFRKHFPSTTNLYGAEHEYMTPTLTTFSESAESFESSSPSLSMSTKRFDASTPIHVAEKVLPTTTETIGTESSAATTTLTDNENATISDEAFLFEGMNSTSKEDETERSSHSNSSSSDEVFTETLADLEGTAPSTATMIMGHTKNFSTSPKRKSKKPSSLTASIATLFYNQFLSTNSKIDNKLAWRPQHGDDYSDASETEAERPTTEATTTEIDENDRVAWWQHHLNHSGNYFWDKGFNDEAAPTLSTEYDWHVRRNHSKHKQRLKHRRNNSKNSHSNSNSNAGNNSRNFEIVSQQPQQAVLASESSLSQSKKYLAEGKSQRQASKPRSHSNKLLGLSAKATHAYSSTMATSHAAESAATVTASTAITAESINTTTTSLTQRAYPRQQLFGKKTFAALHSNGEAQQFDGNTNHLSHTPTASTPTTSSAAMSSASSFSMTKTTAASAGHSTSTTTVAAAAVAGATTKKSIRISTQKLLATPFHQLTYVRNNAGDIDIDNIDNISVYPDLMGVSSEMAEQYSTERMSTDAQRDSRLTIVSGYFPTSSTLTLPESIQLAKVKINKERKRMMVLRQRYGRRPA